MNTDGFLVDAISLSSPLRPLRLSGSKNRKIKKCQLKIAYIGAKIMAKLRLADGTIHTDWSTISNELSPLNIQLNYWSVGEDPQLLYLLEQ